MAYSNYGANAFSNYAGGDYYRGDYYSYAAGGFNPFKAIGGAIKGAVSGFVSGGVTGAVGGAIKGAIGGKSATTGTALATIPQGTTMALPFMPPPPVPRGTPGASPVPGVTGAVQRFLPGGASGYQGGATGAPAGWHWNKSHSYAKNLPAGSFLVRNRSLNPANPRALRRGVRRQQQFIALARRVMKGTGMTIKRSGVGGRARARRK